MENFSVMTSFKKQQLKKSGYIRLLPLSFVAPFFFVKMSDNQFVRSQSKMFDSFLLKSLVTSREALRIVYFDFNGRAAISWREKSWHLISRKKWTSRFKFRQSLSFQPQKAALLEYLRILKSSSPSDLSPRTFSPPSKKRLKQKHQRGEAGKYFVCFLQSKGLR